MQNIQIDNIYTQTYNERDCSISEFSNATENMTTVISHTVIRFTYCTDSMPVKGLDWLLDLHHTF